MSRRRRVLVVVGAAAALASGLAIAAVIRVRGACAEGCYGLATDVPAAEVAIVPGARVWARQPSPMLEERLRAALALYRAGRVKKILASGDHGQHRYDEVNAMRDWLEAAGVAPADVFLDHAGFRTLDTMERARRVFGVSRAVVCTQAFHLPRAVFLARRAGIQAAGLQAFEPAWSGAGRNRVREALAQLGAALDSYVLHRGPRLLGSPIPITGDGRATRDGR